jgi:predicted anti-sigma-YlaC factor YlaD
MSELVTGYMERTLPFRVRVGAWMHLRQCSMCRRYFDQMHKTVDLLADAPPIEPSPDIEESALAVLRARGSAGDGTTAP